jgi:hypothetical protein
MANRKSEFATFLRPDDITEPTELTIVDVIDGQYGAVTVFNDGSQLTINGRNGRALAKQYGWEDRDWIDKTVTLSRGSYEKDGGMKPTILLDPVSPALVEAERTKPPAKRDPIDDEDGPF